MMSSQHKPAMTVKRKCRITNDAMQKVLGQFLGAQANVDEELEVPEDVIHKLEIIRAALQAASEVAPKRS